MNLAGVLAPVPTPLDARDQLNASAFSAAMRRWLPSPLLGFVVLGTTGEAALMTDDEADRIVGLARDIVPSGRPLIIGTGRESTQATIAATRRAASLGADAVLVRTPGFFKTQMTTDVFVRHYTAVADNSPVPVLLYNFTAVTGVNLLPAAVARLAAHPNIVGAKESGGDTLQIAAMVAGTPPGFSVLAGSGSTFFDALLAGATGGILALACLLPEACARLFDLARDKRNEEARALQNELLPIARLVGSTYGVAGLKAALKMRGCDVGPPRPPLVPVPDAAIFELSEALQLL